MNVGSIAFAGVILAAGVVYEWMALAMPRGHLAYPGPGLYPILVGVFLVATALACVVQELLGHARRKRSAAASASTGASGGGAAASAAPPARLLTRSTLQLTALTAAYILLLKPVGYPICILGFLAVAIRIFGYRRWIPTLLIAAVIAAVSYVGFVLWLKVPMPLGLLEDLLG